MANDPLPRQRGIQSIEVGGQLLKALAHHGRPLALKDLAREAGMAAAKAHPYLVSFGHLGLITQDESTGRYGLGPLAMQLGLISLQQLDPLALASPVIDQLAAETGYTAALAVWGNRGATIVRVAHPATPVHVSMRHGTVMSLRGTASGRLFAAWLPKAHVLPVLKSEALLSGRKGEGTFDSAFAVELADIRRLGISIAQGLSLPGINAMAAPIVDGNGTLVLALTVIGPAATLKADALGPLARLLVTQAEALSKRLGCQASA